MAREKKDPLEAFAHQLFICRRSMKRRGDGWVWVRGKRKDDADLVEVEIDPSTSGPKPDFHVRVCFGGHLAFEDWKPTEERAAMWATRKLMAVMNAIGGCR